MGEKSNEVPATWIFSHRGSMGRVGRPQKSWLPLHYKPAPKSLEPQCCCAVARGSVSPFSFKQFCGSHRSCSWTGAVTLFKSEFRGMLCPGSSVVSHSLNSTFLVMTTSRTPEASALGKWQVPCSKWRGSKYSLSNSPGH